MDEFDQITTGVTLAPKCETKRQHSQPNLPATHVAVVMHHHRADAEVRPIVLVCTECAIRLRNDARASMVCPNCDQRMFTHEFVRVVSSIAEYHT